MHTRPDILVLGGGGVLGEAWMMGVLSGLEDATGIDLRGCEYFVGTSAGSIVAANLAAGQSPRRPESLPDPEAETASEKPAQRLGEAGASASRRAGEWALAFASAAAPLALGLAAPGGARMRALLLSRVPRTSQTLNGLRSYLDGLDSQFDGRLRVTAVDRKTGRRVVFGAPGAPQATVAEAVAASCTVPWLFAPVRIGEREYVDGGVWSPTNADAAPVGRGADVLCLNPAASLTGSADIIGVFRRVSRSAAAIETLALRRRGAHVRVVGPDVECADTMGMNLMDRRRARRVLAAGYRQGLALVS